MSNNDHFADIQITTDDESGSAAPPVERQSHLATNNNNNDPNRKRSQSTLSTSSGLQRAPSMARRSEFNDDAEREKNHLREANRNLR